MNVVVTEKNYPIQLTWVFKSFIGTAVVLVIFFMFGPGQVYFWYYLVTSLIYFFILLLRRRNFHYTIDDKFINLEQGILSKSQRHIPYGVVQNIFIKQDLFDRALGLASLSIENAAQGGSNTGNYGKDQGRSVGFEGNKVSIPGLNKEDAEVLKNIVLQKMKDNPVESNLSGL